MKLLRLATDLAMAAAVGQPGDIDAVVKAADPHVLRQLVTDTVFDMAAGKTGIPAWLRIAESVLDGRTEELRS